MGSLTYRQNCRNAAFRSLVLSSWASGSARVGVSMAETFNTAWRSEKHPRASAAARCRRTAGFTSGAAASEEHSESSMVSGRMEALSWATTATRPLFWEKNTGRLAQQPPPRTPSPARRRAQ